MRKVTASAVILTALTGCSQSGSIPSSQWSFEVPSESEISNSQSELESEALSTLDPSTESSSFVEKFSGRRTMGPAFEQPAVDVSASAAASQANKQAEISELSTLPAETYGLASGVSDVRRSTRPDPVAQVRAYLRASGSPSALTSRVPYTSQVYLSSLPVPKQYYNADIAPAALPSPVSPSAENAPAVGIDTLNLTESLTDTSAINATADFFPALSSVSSNFDGSLPAVNEPADVSAYSQVSIASPIPADSSDPVADYAAPTDTNLAEAVSYSDGLPQLVPGTTVFTPTEEISIGTAILNNLQQSSVAVSGTATSRTVSSDIVLEPLPQVATLSAAAIPPAGNLANNQEAVLDTVTGSTIAYPLAVQVSSQAFTSTYASAQATPTLARLTETMPSREVSPLVANYRASGDLGNTIAPTQTSDLLEDFSSSETLDSPLLDSFREDTPLSTLYVPIAEPVSADISGPMIKNAINALGNGVPTSDFVDNLAKTELFSTVLASPALVNNVAVSDERSAVADAQGEKPSAAQRIPFVGKDFLPREPIKVFADQRAKSARKAAVTFAAKQVEKRRQHLNWL